MTLFASTWITSTTTTAIVAEGTVSTMTISRNLWYVDNGRNDDDLLDLEIDLLLAWVVVDGVDVTASLLVLLV